MTSARWDNKYADDKYLCVLCCAPIIGHDYRELWSLALQVSYKGRQLPYNLCPDCLCRRRVLCPVRFIAQDVCEESLPAGEVTTRLLLCAQLLVPPLVDWDCAQTILRVLVLLSRCTHEA